MGADRAAFRLSAKRPVHPTHMQWLKYCIRGQVRSHQVCCATALCRRRGGASHSPVFALIQHCVRDKGRDIYPAASALRLSALTTTQIPIPDTSMPDAICQDSRSSNIIQASSVVTGGLRYRTLATRVSEARRRQIQ